MNKIISTLKGGKAKHFTNALFADNCWTGTKVLSIENKTHKITSRVNSSNMREEKNSSFYRLVICKPLKRTSLYINKTFEEKSIGIY